MIKNEKCLHFGGLLNKALYYILNIWDELRTCCMGGRYIIFSRYISYCNRNYEDAWF